MCRGVMFEHAVSYAAFIFYVVCVCELIQSACVCMCACSCICQSFLRGVIGLGEDVIDLSAEVLALMAKLDERDAIVARLKCESVDFGHAQEALTNRITSTAALLVSEKVRR